MRIASYNIFEGAKASLSQLEEFVQQQDLDTLCLQEANDWLDGDPSQLERFATATGLAHIASGGNRRFKIATLSRLPVARTEIHSEGFWHGAVETEVETPTGFVNIWNTHLNPMDEDKRVPEAEYIASHVDTSKPTLVVGDFNSLSEADNYPRNLAQTLAAKGILKFGAAANRYDVTRILSKSGLYDIAALLGVETSTVPTPVNTDPYHAAKLRLDYMFASESLIRRVNELAVPKTYLTDRISDHYPQVLTITG